MVHRLLHASPLMRHNVHSVHHAHKGRLYSWISAEVHPVEALFINTALFYPFVLYGNRGYLHTWAALNACNATMLHSGYTLPHFPGFLTAQDHALHHEEKQCFNYGNMLRIWDYVGGTLN
jgi:sterol desaturase/sphingolipid hydroxylase (fatty acid hydroxylase superfamily)